MAIMDGGDATASRDILRPGKKDLIQAIERNDHIEVFRIIETFKGSKLHQTLLNWGLCHCWHDDRDDIAQRLLSHGAHSNCKPGDRLNPTFLAAHRTHSRILSTLLDNGAELEMIGHKGRTPLMYARDTSTVNILLDREAKIEAKDEYGNTPLIRALIDSKHTQVALLLIERGANIEASDDRGRTVLMQAVWKNRANVVETLLQRGVDLSRVDRRGRNVFHHLGSDWNRCERRRPERKKDKTLKKPFPKQQSVMTMLFEAEGSSRYFGAPDELGRSPLHWASMCGNSDYVQLLVERCPGSINKPDGKQRTPLHLAAAHHHTITMKILLDHGAAMNAKSDAGMTPLHSVCSNSETELETVKLLIDKYGAEVDMKNCNGQTAVHIAAISGKWDVMEYLLGLREVVVAQKDGHGNTAFLYACSNVVANVATMKLLVDTHKADYTIRDGSGKNALHLAAQVGNWKVTEYLLALPGMKATQIDDMGHTPLMYATSHPDWNKNGIKIIDQFSPSRRIVEFDDDAINAAKECKATVIDFGHSDRDKTKAKVAADGKDRKKNGNADDEALKALAMSKAIAKARPTVTRQTIHKLLYEPGSCVSHSPQRSFRWIHLPANNMTWCFDLLTKHFIEDIQNIEKKVHHIDGKIQDIEKKVQDINYKLREMPKKIRRIEKKIRKIEKTAQDVEMKDHYIEIKDRYTKQKAEYSEKKNRYAESKATYIKQKAPYMEEEALVAQTFAALEKSFSHQHRGGKLHARYMTPLCYSVIPPRSRYPVEPDKPDAKVDEGSESADNAQQMRRSTSRTKKHPPTGRSKGNKGRKKNRNRAKDKRMAQNSEQEQEGVDETAHDETEFFCCSGLYMFTPFLHYQTFQSREDMWEVACSVNEDKDPSVKSNKSPGVAQLRAFLKAPDFPLHMRRTLDQYFYHNINTTYRDRDQVIHRYQKRIDTPTDKVKILMVDQLWMWVVRDDLVVTSFPEPWIHHSSGYDRAESRGDICSEIRDIVLASKRPPVANAYELAMFITGRCFSAFDRQQIGNRGLQSLDMFESELGNAIDKEIDLFRTFDKNVKDADDWSRQPEKKLGSPSETPESILNLFDIGKETDLLREIKDIIDELDMLSMIFECQFKQVLPNLKQALKEISDYRFPDEHLDEDTKRIFDDQMKRFYREHERTIDHPYQDVERMRRLANRIHTSVKDLLDLKQKQVNIIEARASRNQAEATYQQAESTTKQGNILTVFTTVSVIFLPLSFIATFFTINLREFPQGNNGNSLSVSFVLSFVLGLGLPVALLSVALARRLDRGLAWLRNSWRWIAPKILSFIRPILLFPKLQEAADRKISAYKQEQKKKHKKGQVGTTVFLHTETRPLVAAPLSHSFGMNHLLDRPQRTASSRNWDEEKGPRGNPSYRGTTLM